LGSIRSREALLVAGLVLVALALRLPTVGDQSFWLDESYTGRIVDGSFGHAWSQIQRTENTPPLFYVLDWLWSRAFGTSEGALRSLSAVAGALTVVPMVALVRRVGEDGIDGTRSATAVAEGPRPRAEGAAAAGGDPRAANRPTGRPVPLAVGLAAGLLIAVNPLAHWFSQEARSYALFLLLSAAAWGALVGALERPTRRRLALWAVAAVAASWTHYFGGLLFLVGWAALAASAIGRSDGGRRRALRPLALPAGLSAAALAALVPIAANQRSTDMYRDTAQAKDLLSRVAETPKQFVVGYGAPGEFVVGVVLILVLGGLVLAGAWPRGGRPTRGTSLLVLTGVLWLLPALPLVFGLDVVLTRNYVLLLPPLLALAALGAWRLGRRGTVALGAVVVVQLAVVVIVAATPLYQREDWRGLLRAAEEGRPTPQLLLVGGYQPAAAQYYSPTLRERLGGDPALRSIVVVDRFDGDHPLPRTAVPQPPPGFTLVRAVQKDQWRVFVWDAPVPTPVSAELIAALKTRPARSAALRP
jgi:4-amino-4-deoxy-L-arabinose transferase-like glycosyltransferase